MKSETWTCGSRPSYCRSCKTTSFNESRQGNHQGGRAHHGGDAPRSGKGHYRGNLPRGPLLPPDVINLKVPPLRDRKEDIVPLAEFLIKKHTAGGLPAPPIPLGLKHAMMTYHWPGNVRELENYVRSSSSSAIPSRSRANSMLRRSSQCADADCRGPFPAGRTDESSPILEQVTQARKQPKRTPSWRLSIPLAGTETSRGAAENRLQGSAIQDEEAGCRGPSRSHPRGCHGGAGSKCLPVGTEGWLYRLLR